MAFLPVKHLQVWHSNRLIFVLISLPTSHRYMYVLAKLMVTLIPRVSLMMSCLKILHLESAALQRDPSLHLLASLFTLPKYNT